jgi:hypothetical protein
MSIYCLLFGALPLGEAGEAAGQPRLPGRVLVRQELQAQREHPQRYYKSKENLTHRRQFKNHCVRKKRSRKIRDLCETSSPPF